MAGYVLCQYCKDTVPTKEKRTLAVEVKVSETTGKSKPNYYHQECYPKHLERQAFIDKEMSEKDELNEVVKKIYNVTYQLPPRYWELINDLRNGTNRFQKFWKKKYKRGIPFDVLKESYIMCKPDIEWARFNKNFKSLDQELRYGLIIIQGKVNDAYRKMKAREQQNKINEAMEKVHIEDMRENREVSFKKKANEGDYSYLLGND